MSTDAHLGSRSLRDTLGPAAAPPRATPAAALADARALFRQGERLDMVRLATDLGVARGTLYRWTGGREQLLADVVWLELRDVATACLDHAPGTGADRLDGAVGAFLELVAGAAAMRSLLANEGDAGLRLITAPRGLVRPRLVATIAELIDREAAAGTYAPPAPTAVLAEGIVTIAERFLHNGGDPELNPDPATARTIVALLLRERAGS